MAQSGDVHALRTYLNTTTKVYKRIIIVLFTCKISNNDLLKIITTCGFLCVFV